MCLPLKKIEVKYNYIIMILLISWPCVLRGPILPDLTLFIVDWIIAVNWYVSARNGLRQNNKIEDVYMLQYKIHRSFSS